MMTTSRRLPLNWVWTELGEITEIILGQSPPSTTYNADGHGLPFYQGKKEFGEIYPIPEVYCSVPKKIAEKGDVLISVRAPVGPTNICPEKSCIGRGLAAIRGLAGISSFFLLYLMRSQKSELAGKGVGSTFTAINGDQLRKLPIPLPPLPEQHRIVNKIEELFSQLDAGFELLQKTKVLLNQYRQSVLKAAFEGKLTEEWRKHNSGKLSSPGILVEKSKADRSEYNPSERIPTIASALEMAPIPSEWVYAPLWLFFSWSNGKGLTKQKMQGGQYPVYGGNGVIGTHDSFLTDSESLVIGRVGAQCGNVHIAPAQSWVTDNAIYSDWSSTHISFKYVLHLLRWKNLNRLSGGSGQPYVNQKILNSIFIPIPPREEQDEIVQEIETSFSIADAIANIVQASVDQTVALKSMILRAAFQGKLVPQDPNDEPASKLLERIKAER